MSVNDRINYKISIFIHSAIHHNWPSYLSNCDDIVKQSRHTNTTPGECDQPRHPEYLPGSASSIFRRCWICDVELATSSLRTIKETKKKYLKLFF